MIACVVPRRANKRINHRLALLAVAHGGVKPAPQAVTQGFGHDQTLAFNVLHDPMRQGRDPHPCRHHLNEQQGIIHAFQQWADTGRLQKMAPNIQTLALHRVNQQRFTCEILWCDARFTGQGMICRQHQPYFKIKHWRIMQPAARQDV